MDKYYVYTLAYPDGTVFYVGKGSGSRINQHEKDARSGIVSMKCDIIRAIWERGEDVVKAKVAESLNEGEAYRREVALIKEYGLEALANQVTGIAGAPKGNKNRAIPEDQRKRGKTTILSMDYATWEAFKAATDLADGCHLEDDETYKEYWRDLCRGTVRNFIERHQGIADPEVMIV